MKAKVHASLFSGIGGPEVAAAFIILVLLRTLKQFPNDNEELFTKHNALFDKCVENCDPEIMKKVSDEIDAQLEKEQERDGGDDYNKGYIKGRAASWKPSEEQMKMLAMFTNLRCASRREANILESLYNDLKKLK